MTEAASRERCLCGSERFDSHFHYDAQPAGEVCFEFGAGETYRREVKRCQVCGHFVSIHGMDVGALYAGGYVDSTYGDEDGIRRDFDRINGLPADQSDNVGRVQRVVEFAGNHFGSRAPRVLDVGSGLCVFPYRLKLETGWECTVLDPDPRVCRHARDVVSIPAVNADFMQVAGLGRFDALTFNKVLEHVLDPVGMLARARAFLEESGFVYLEVPDGEVAALAGPGREEFFIEHHHVFSVASLAVLVDRAGFRVMSLERLREPSGKFTLRAFVVAAEIEDDLDQRCRPDRSDAGERSR